MAWTVSPLPSPILTSPGHLPPLTGTSARRLDSKHRLVLPIAAARAIREAGGVVYVLPGHGGALEVLPERAFEAAVLDPSRSTLDPEEARILDALIAKAERVLLRGPGRITVPHRYRPLLDGDRVLVVGRDWYIEIVTAAP